MTMIIMTIVTMTTIIIFIGCHNNYVLANLLVMSLLYYQENRYHGNTPYTQTLLLNVHVKYLIICIHAYMNFHVKCQ